MRLEGIWNAVNSISSQIELDCFLLRNLGVSNRPIVFSRVSKDASKEVLSLQKFSLGRKNLGLMKHNSKTLVIDDNDAREK
jgi:hypothetical protein